jgi:hypothetical protein
MDIRAAPSTEALLAHDKSSVAPQLSKWPPVVPPCTPESSHWGSDESDDEVDSGIRPTGGQKKSSSAAVDSEHVRSRPQRENALGCARQDRIMVQLLDKNGDKVIRSFRPRIPRHGRENKKTWSACSSTPHAFPFPHHEIVADLTPATAHVCLLSDA